MRRVLGPEAAERTLSALRRTGSARGAVGEDPRTLERFVADGVALEVCPDQPLAGVSTRSMPSPAPAGRCRATWPGGGRPLSWVSARRADEVARLLGSPPPTQDRLEPRSGGLAGAATVRTWPSLTRRVLAPSPSPIPRSGRGPGRSRPRSTRGDMTREGKRAWELPDRWLVATAALAAAVPRLPPESRSGSCRTWAEALRCARFDPGRRGPGSVLDAGWPSPSTARPRGTAWWSMMPWSGAAAWRRRYSP